MRLLTDFEDYYDELLLQYEVDDGLIYNRKLSDSTGKFEELQFLRSLGVSTIELMPVAKATCEKLVVYTDTKLHMGEGKRVLSLTNAYDMYYNSICSEYFTGNENTYKILQIGSKRYSLVVKNEGLRETSIIRIDALPDGMTECIDSPIYSIDYINKNGNMLACDFNRVQKLKHLDLEKYLPSALIVNTINEYYNNKKKNQRNGA